MCGLYSVFLYLWILLTFKIKIMKKLKTILMLTALISLTVISCKKGDTGPIGPAGTNGTNGTNGNANVTNFNITIHTYDWTYASTYSEFHYNYYVSGDFESAVLGYVMSGNGEQVLPYVSNVLHNRLTLSSNLSSSTPFVQFQWTNLTTTTTAPTSDYMVRLVIIPPAVRIANPNVNYNDYNAVKKAFNLKD